MSYERVTQNVTVVGGQGDTLEVPRIRSGAIRTSVMQRRADRAYPVESFFGVGGHEVSRSVWSQSVMTPRFGSRSVCLTSDQSVLLDGYRSGQHLVVIHCFVET